MAKKVKTIITVRQYPENEQYYLFIEQKNKALALAKFENKEKADLFQEFIDGVGLIRPGGMRDITEEYKDES